MNFSSSSRAEQSSLGPRVTRLKYIFLTTVYEPYPNPRISAGAKPWHNPKPISAANQNFNPSSTLQ